ncbi:hypothetical protein TIFTF001_014242 [Ficus carica]|uniref:Uncharacterized protein n=1 Tax=Ficus carica TaxID=3494 RepID=A0AA87ZWG0_FICCA|nr:hypothetical protein TIFTF001_014242 [Ficus carica]
MEKIMAMLSSAIQVGGSSSLDSSWCHHREPSVTLTEEFIDSEEEEVDGANKRFVGLGYLEENLASNLTAEEIESWRKRFGIPEGIKLRVPHSSKRADSPHAGWFALYELSLLSGMRFLLPELASELLQYCGIVIGQLMPNTWRVLYGMSVVDLLCF